MGIDIAMLFPTPMLSLSNHPQIDVQTQLARGYNRWLVELVLPGDPRIRTMLKLPIHDPDASYQMVVDFGDKPGVSGFMVAAIHDALVYGNALMKTYAAIQGCNLPIAFHAGFNSFEGPFKTANKFISVRALGFTFYNMLHLTNWVMNGMPERFPALRTIWMESGLAWLPFLM